MKELYRPGLTWGIATGLFIIVLLYTKQFLRLPSGIMFAANLATLLLAMIGGVVAYRRRAGVIGFKPARELAFLIYASAAVVLCVYRLFQGYFFKFSFPGVVFGLLLMYGVGRLVSYVVGLRTYNYKAQPDTPGTP